MNPKIAQTLFPVYGNCLKLLTQNIRSISVNISGFLMLLSRLNLTQDIVVLIERWLSCNSKIPPIDGYNHYFSSKNINQNDGVVVYMRKDIKEVTIIEPVLVDANCMLIRIGRKTVILAVYRPLL